jgi:peptidoglycan/LPS O-acetylase OafA/YrhL
VPRKRPRRYYSPSAEPPARGTRTTHAMEPADPSRRPRPEGSAWDSTIARAVATVLIANSHLEAFYPRSWMAADGLLGNTLFFMISGLGLAAHNRTRELSFGAWYGRRVLRIYPSVWICVAVLMLGLKGAWATWTPFDYFAHLVWPTPHQYVEAVMVFYGLAYVLLRHAQGRGWWAPAALAMLVALGYAAASALSLPDGPLALGKIAGPFWNLWWLVTFLIGMALPRVRLPALPLGSLLGTAGGGLCAYVALKYAMVVQGFVPKAFIALHVVAAICAIALLAVSAHPEARGWLRHRPIGPAVAWLGGLSLEIYIVHGFVAGRPEIAGLPFPLNIAAYAACTAALAYAVAKAADWMRNGVSRYAPGSAVAARVPETPRS